jgi:glycosyltransferase 2 family protein
VTRQRALRGARAGLVVLSLALAWWGFRGRWSEIGAAATDTGPLRLAAAVVCTAAGLALTALLWRLLLRWVGPSLGVREAAEVFLVGQLGKYVPGSVWSVAAQAQLGRRHDVPARASATASALFLLVHTATGLLLGGLLLVAGALGLTFSTAWAWAALGVGAVALVPPVVRRLADRLAGRGTRTVFGVSELATTAVLMTAAWACYGAALLLLVPGGAPLGRPGSLGFVGAVAAFALAHAAGVLVVLAPAGVGVREGVLVVLLAPVLGVPGAAAVALLSRVAHAVADFAVAGLATAWARAGSVRPDAAAPEPARAHSD